MRKKPRLELIAELLIEGIVFAAEAKGDLQTFKIAFRKCSWNVESGEIDVDCISWEKFKLFIEAELSDYGKGYFESDKCKDRFGKSGVDACYLTYAVDFLVEYESAENNIKEGRGRKPITFKLQNLSLPQPNVSLKEYAQEQIKVAKERQALNRSSYFSGEDDSLNQSFSQMEFSVEKGIPKYPVGTRFIDGRERELSELHQELQASVADQENPMAISVCGMGGIGKSELCIHYIKRKRKFYDDYICWVDMLDINPAEQLLEFAEMNGYNEKRTISTENNLRKLWHWSGWRNKKILLIYDDVWSVSDLEKLLPPLEYTQFYILITSRTKALPEQAKNWDIRNVKNYIITTISSEAGHMLFKRYAPDEIVNLEEEAIEDILVFVGYLPIAILSVAGYTLKFSVNLNAVVDELFSLRNEWENDPKGVMNLDYFKFSDEAPKTTKHASIYISFLMTWSRLSTATRKACILLSISPQEIVLKSIFIPLGETFEITREPELKPKKLSEAIADIQNLFILNLVSERTASSDVTYSCHDLYRDFFRSQMTKEEVSLWADTYKQIRAFRR